MPYTTLKKLADRYPMMVETKGGRVLFKARRLVITSNIAPQQWYPKYPFDSLERRITGWFKHETTEAPIHGLPAGTTLVTKLKGKWAYHPCNPHLRPIDGPEDCRILDIDTMAEEFSTQPIDDIDALY